MAQQSIPAHILSQRGKPIVLIDGTQVTLVYTFSSLMRIEEDFGSVAAALQAIRAGERGSVFTSIAQICAAGLEHESMPPHGARLSDVDVLSGYLDPQRVEQYSDALGDALAAAFPETKAEAEAGGDDADPQPDSRGESGTTSPPSPSVEAMPSSGE